jgi:flavin-dependent dehydrogenase
VVLVDAQDFPRDKVCGDALVPDAHAALRQLGLHERVMALARPVGEALCRAPAGHGVAVAGEMAVLPRQQLDVVLCQAATEAGAQLFTPLRFEAVLRDPDGRVCGARLKHGGQAWAVQANWVVLATGANTAPLLAAGVCTRRTPSGMALRAHVRHPALSAEMQSLRFTWHRELPGGYGWIFPGPDHTFNIGVGVLDNYEDDAQVGRWRWSRRARRRSGMNLRDLFAAFLAVDPVAARLMREGVVCSELKGAPLRCDLTGATWASPGLLLVGEAAGGTYSFTGEGIGKAMETGLAAAEALVTLSGDQAIMAGYEHSLRQLLPRYLSYRQAGSFNRFPWLADLVIWRARRSPRIQAKLADVLNETRLPGSLLTWRAVRNLIKP